MPFLFFLVKNPYETDKRTDQARNVAYGPYVVFRSRLMTHPFTVVDASRCKVTVSAFVLYEYSF